MNNAKHSGGKRTPRHGRRLGFGRQVLLLAALAVIAMGVVGGTVAYLVTNTTPVTNTFEPGYVTCVINEKGPDGKEGFKNNSDTVKKNVTVTNTGIVDAYIRAAIIVTWKSGNDIVATVPVNGTDYVITGLENNAKWKEVGGYYYYSKKVSPEETTSNLFDSCEVLTDNGYTLSVEILADAIQAEPERVVEENWHVSIKNGIVAVSYGGITN